MTIGLPASGKSTWAREQVEKSSGKIVRVNKDDLRAMLHNSKFSSANENQVLRIRDSIILDTLSCNKTVIVDDTNFHPKHEKTLREYAELHSAEFEIKSFTDVPLSECLARDAIRPNPVGAKVIKKMYNDYLKEPEVPPKARIDGLPTCIVIDVDGTLALMGARNPFDWKNVDKDTVNMPVADLVRMYRYAAPEDKILIVSGRDGSCADLTKGWLSLNGIPFDEFYMRPEGDSRKDAIIKEEIYRNHIENRYNVRFVLDDRDQVVKMWRGLGIPVFQVAEGDF